MSVYPIAACRGQKMGEGILWTWSYRQLWAIMWLPRNELYSPEKLASALNYRAISPALCLSEFLLCTRSWVRWVDFHLSSSLMCGWAASLPCTHHCSLTVALPSFDLSLISISEHLCHCSVSCYLWLSTSKNLAIFSHLAVNKRLKRQSILYFLRVVGNLLLGAQRLLCPQTTRKTRNVKHSGNSPHRRFYLTGGFTCFLPEGWEWILITSWWPFCCLWWQTSPKCPRMIIPLLLSLDLYL